MEIRHSLLLNSAKGDFTVGHRVSNSMIGLLLRSRPEGDKLSGGRGDGRRGAPLNWRGGNTLAFWVAVAYFGSQAGNGFWNVAVERNSPTETMVLVIPSSTGDTGAGPTYSRLANRRLR
jgi:hypothetical protein